MMCIACSRRSPLVVALCIALALACFVGLGIAGLNPPNTVPVSAPLSAFSSGRAMRHLQIIARTPHTTGSAENHAVRDYLVQELAALGLDPEVQQATVVATTRRGRRPCWRSMSTRRRRCCRPVWTARTSMEDMYRRVARGR